jgi:hypothetical protein
MHFQVGEWSFFKYLQLNASIIRFFECTARDSAHFTDIAENTRLRSWKNIVRKKKEKEKERKGKTTNKNYIYPFGFGRQCR